MISYNGSVIEGKLKRLCVMFISLQHDYTIYLNYLLSLKEVRAGLIMLIVRVREGLKQINEVFLLVKSGNFPFNLIPFILFI